MKRHKSFFEGVLLGIRNSKLEIPAVLMTICCLLLAISCTAGKGGQPRGTPTALYQLADEVRFSNADLGKSIQLRRNQTVLVVLKSDPDVYGRWTVKSTNPQIIALLTTKVRGENAIDDCWLFTARGYGNCTLKMVYTPY